MSSMNLIRSSCTDDTLLLIAALRLALTTLLWILWLWIVR